MELISLQGKTNFFEKRVGDYQKASTAWGSFASPAVEPVGDYQKAGVAKQADATEGESGHAITFDDDMDF